MLNEYSKKNVHELSENCSFSYPTINTEKLTFNSPATRLMHDFREKSIVLANEEITVNSGLQICKEYRVSFLAVTDQDNQFIGIITMRDMMGLKPMQFANEANISRQDVLVKNIMYPKHHLKTISLLDVERSSIGDIMYTLDAICEKLILVDKEVNGIMKICGLFLARDFQNSLGVKFEPNIVAHNFFEIEQVVNDGKEII